ncbi:MAG TPA: peptidoglycan bridge formation glycyltransferase FemA/FemB family protein, partial [Bacilli bacterium]|nr:peptidoglycan bridge formation glycyltransferase FemA/FemB family protein [Bacilli bacterium]
MEIAILNEETYNEYAVNHPNYNFFQSIYYGKVMKNSGYEPFYLGLVDESGSIEAATLILVKESKGKQRTGYCPRGFLIDWNNDNLVINFTNLLKKFLSKRSFIYIKVDPLIIYKEHSKADFPNNMVAGNDTFIKKLQALNYVHLGFNKGFESQKPRWNINIELNNTTLQSLNEDTKRKINDSKKYGCQVFRGNKNDIDKFYNLVKTTSNLNKEFYLNFFDIAEDKKLFEIYFSRIDPGVFVKNSRTIYEEEENRNQELNNMIQDMSIVDKTDILNKKMESDLLLGTYKQNMLKAIDVFQNNPDGILGATTAVVKFNGELIFWTVAINDEFKTYFPEYNLYSTIIEDCIRLGFKTA